MTVQLESPYITYQVSTDPDAVYGFQWSSVDSTELKLTILDLVLTEGIHYEIEEYDPDTGGVIRLTLVNHDLLIDQSLVITRSTPSTQEAQYVQGAPFPAETHEAALDKLTRILQEIVFGAAIRPPVDLDVIQFLDRVDITNTGGTDASIYPWDIFGREAGVFTGRIVDTAPADGEATTFPDGFVWLEVNNFQQDSRIVMETSLISGGEIVQQPSAANPFIEYNKFDGKLRVSSTNPEDSPPGYTIDLVIDPPLGTGEETDYWVQLEDRTDPPLPWGSTAADLNVWLPAGSTGRYLWWFFQSGIGFTERETVFKVAPDDGSGTAPDESRSVERNIVVTATVTS